MWDVSLDYRFWSLARETSQSVGGQCLRLREAAGVVYCGSDISITPTICCNRQSMLALTFERVGHQGASHGGLSTKNKRSMTIDVINSALRTLGDYCRRYLVFENLFALREGAIDVLASELLKYRDAITTRGHVISTILKLNSAQAVQRTDSQHFLR